MRRKKRSPITEHGRRRIREWQLANPDKVKEYARKRLADRVTEEYNAKMRVYHKIKMERRAGRPKPDLCEACGKTGKICFDHCHERNVFRGWICDSCNVTLGRMRDDIKALRDLANYLERFHEQEVDRRCNPA